MKNLFSLIIISISVLAFSCSNQGEEETIVSFEVIHGGTYCSISGKKEVLIKNNDDYQKLMNEVYSNLDQMPRIPEVDFSKNSVVAVFMGTKNTGGYLVNVDKVIKRTSALTVSIYETSPGANCQETQMLSQPYEIVKIPKTDQKVKYIYKQRTKDCN